MAAISRECQRKAGTHDGGAEGSRKTPRSATKRDHGSLAEGFSEGVEGAAAQGEGTDSGGGIAGAEKKVGGLLLGRRRRLTSAVQRRMAIELIVEASFAGARLVSACCELGISLRSLKCWRRAFGSDEDGEDRRIGSSRLVSHCLSEEERQRILLTCNQPEYASLPPGQIMPILDDRGSYNSFGEDCVYGSERSFYRDLHTQGSGPAPWPGTAAPGAASGAASGGQSPKSALEPGHHLPAYQRLWCLALPADQQGTPPASDPPCR